MTESDEIRIRHARDAMLLMTVGVSLPWLIGTFSWLWSIPAYPLGLIFGLIGLMRMPVATPTDSSAAQPMFCKACGNEDAYEKLSVALAGAHAEEKPHG